jgi:hypothetical protein
MIKKIFCSTEKIYFILKIKSTSSCDGKCCPISAAIGSWSNNQALNFLNEKSKQKFTLIN